MATAQKLNQILREDERQENLLEDAIRTADALDAVRSLRLYRHVMKRVENLASATVTEVKASEPAPTSMPTTAPMTGGKVTYADKAEAFIFANAKKGVTTRAVGEAIGQNYRSADATIRYVVDRRKSVERRDNKWFPKGDAKPDQGHDRELTNGEAITTVFQRNGNTPLAAKDVFVAVKAISPKAKKGSVDAQLVVMRNEGKIVRSGDAPHGGGLYHLTNLGGAKVE
jgi:hypothetical protein